MALVLNEEQQLLKESAEGFFAEKAPVSQLRELRDNGDETGFSQSFWQEMAEMGFAGLLIDEENGGTDFGLVGAGIVAEAKGRCLSASPFLASSVIAASVIQAVGTDVQKAALLPQIASGEVIATLAIDEGARHKPQNTALKATKTDNGYSLSGLKTFVSDGHVADTIIVVARTSGSAGDTDGISLFTVAANSAGLIVDRTSMADSRNWAKLTFENVEVGAENLLGEEGSAFVALDNALDRSRVVVAAELLGVAQEAFDRTVEYLRERKQFGVPIGSFQGLQHRAAHLFGELAVARSAVLKAMVSADEGKNIAVLASVAKAKAAQTAELATNEAVQMHGGIGMTDEFEIGFFIKRARVLQQLFGDFNFHADRFATLNGY